MAKTLVASVVAAVAVVAAWLSLEQPRLLRDAVAVAALAIAPSLVRAGRARLIAILPSVLCASWIAFGAQPWELLPFRDERVLAPMLHDAGTGIVDFYGVFLPFVPTRNTEMHTLVLCAIFGFTLAAALLVAARRPIAAAAVTVAGVGWPATLADGSAVGFGTLALAAGLAIPLVLRASSLRTLAAGSAIGALVVLGAASASSVTTLGRDAALNWESWDIRGPTARAPSVPFVWESNYNGVRFPKEKTVVFTVKGPAQATYWRASTLNLFSEDHWFEHLLWLGRVPSGSRIQLAPGQPVPARVLKRENWTEPSPNGAAQRHTIEQEVRVEAFVDDHLVAAGTPIALESRRLGTVFQLSGNVLRVSGALREGTTYRVWSYVPDPSPAQLAAAPSRYSVAAMRYLEVDGRELPAFGIDERDQVVDRFFADPSYGAFRRYRPLYDVAHRVAHGADTPYEAVLALESWFRQRGGFRYDESPPRIKNSPLVAFVTRTKVGYCQHFAGAMAVMLRMLGIPSRVAVGFTSGTKRANNTWVVTDHEAHAWVEVWFPGLGWIPFDPTPGRGTFGGAYSFASDSNAAVAALKRGELSRRRTTSPRLPDAGDLPGTTASPESRAPSLVAVALLLAALWIVLVGVGKSLVRRARYTSRDPRRLATASRRELEGFLRDQGADVPPNATLDALQQAVRDELGLDGRAFTRAVARARYGPSETAKQGAETARTELRRLLRSARRELSLRARLRGFASLRSLRSASAR